MDSHLAIGVELGWLGFPALAQYTLCFFSGNVSAYQSDRKAYLIDGVAIPGVSGGPVVITDGAGGCQFVGIVSAYHRGGQAMPGLLVAQDVSHFHSVVLRLKTWEEARAKKAEEEAKRKQEQSQSPELPTESEPES